MKTAPECLPCFLQQSLRVARLQDCGEDIQGQVVRTVAALLPGLEPGEAPPANAMKIYAAIAAVTGCPDPYLSIKREENRRALLALPALRAEVAASPDPLAAAIGFAIAANIIDYGTAARPDVREMLAKSRRLEYAVDHRCRMLARIKALRPGAAVLYLADNCGEIVYDSLVVELLALQGLEVTVVVRGAPIINDALLEDAQAAGIQVFASVISNGVACPGTPLGHCSKEFGERFYRADLVISKGQGNFETLSEVDREIFFLLTVKCPVVARHLAARARCERTPASSGELVVYHYLPETNGKSGE